MTRDERIAAIRARLERSNPFSALYDDAKWLLSEVDALDVVVSSLSDELDEAWTSPVAGPAQG